MTSGILLGDGLILRRFSVVCLGFIMVTVTLTDAADDGGQKRTDESSFGSEKLIGAIRETFDTIFEYIGDKDGCKFTCPNGVRPKSRKEHKPTSNGCGSFGIQLDARHVPSIERCCHEHDVCYDTCNSVKDTCDDKFRDCLNKICKDIKKHFSKDVYDMCKSTADIMYAGTMTLGCKPFRDSQRNACYCPSLPNRSDL